MDIIESDTLTVNSIKDKILKKIKQNELPATVYMAHIIYNNEWTFNNTYLVRVNRDVLDPGICFRISSYVILPGSCWGYFMETINLFV